MIVIKPYRRDRAVTYARAWALERNPLFSDFSGLGGNCTNFVSQCILAGSCTMNYTADYGWYYISQGDRAPAWSGVDFFYNFMIGDPAFERRNDGIGPFGVETGRDGVEPGDVIQIAAQGTNWSHTVIVSGFAEDGEILVCAHSVDSLDRPLSTYEYENIRFIRILGVREETDDSVCFEYLLRGGAEETDANEAEK